MSSAEELTSLTKVVMQSKAKPDEKASSLISALDALIDGTYNDEKKFNLLSISLKKIKENSKNQTIIDKTTALLEKYSGSVKSAAPKNEISRSTSAEDTDKRAQKRQIIRKVLKEHGLQEQLAIELANKIEDEVNTIKVGNEYDEFVIYLLQTIDKKDKLFKITDKLKSGALTPKDFVNAPKEQFMTDEEKAAVEEAYQNAMNKISVPKPKRIASGVFVCPRCKGRNTVSDPVQTRGGDEPMTNFCECLDCGLHFKR